MPKVKEIPVLATCACCSGLYWATEAYVAMVQAGKMESICISCNNKGWEGGEDDNSAELHEAFLESEPEPDILDR